jgi:hypothetical protein
MHHITASTCDFTKPSQKYSQSVHKTSFVKAFANRFVNVL